MTKVSDHVSKQNTRLDNIEASVSGITSDIAEMNNIIEKFQNTSGEITAEDAALLDALEARGDAVAAKLAALDAARPAV